MSDEKILKVDNEIGELLNHQQCTEKLETLIQTVGAASTDEIDRVISQLEDVRAMLQGECERVNQEVNGYERLSETAMYAAKDVHDRLKLRKTGNSCIESLNEIGLS